MPNAVPRIAILGWGSLLWDRRPEFDDCHEDWKFDGPTLPLEFSRISKSRNGALTLVIDQTHGDPCSVAYAMSKRREGTSMKRIGFWFADRSRTCSVETPDTVAPWGTSKGFDVVVWTGLDSNFDSKTKLQFSVETVLRHLDSLQPEGRAMAANYVTKAPAFVRKPLRTELEPVQRFNELRSTE